MPDFQFESIGSSLARLPQLLQSIPDAIRNPAANPLQAAILLGIAIVLVLMVVVTIFLLVIRPTEEEEELLAEEQAGSEEEWAAERAAFKKERRRSRLTVLSIVVIVMVGLWVVAGVTTSNSEVCSSCHRDTSHVAAKGEDPHKDVPCVDCHEGGGTVSRVTVNVFTRVQHVASARIDSKLAQGFGTPVASDGCFSCHKGQISGTFFDKRLQVKVSHKEPIAAGAQCVDCHALRFGTVTAATVGMSPCLRCHNGTLAKAGCEECHVGDPSQAIRPQVALNKMATVQVPNPQCSGCHKDMTTCNACHGIAMPHSADFKGYGREGAVAIWNNDLQMCLKCHYPGHRNCQQLGCHDGAFPSHGMSWKEFHKLAAWPTAKTKYQNGACACHGWNPYQHDGVTFCEICHSVKPNGAQQ